MRTLQAFRRAVILRHQRQTLRLISLCSHPGITRSLDGHIAIPGGRNNIRRIEKQGQEVCVYRILNEAVVRAGLGEGAHYRGGEKQAKRAI